MRYLFLWLLAPPAFGEAVPGRYIIELTGDSAVEHVTRRRGFPADARRTAIRYAQDKASFPGPRPSVSGTS